jgi:hypothetical protein
MSATIRARADNAWVLAKVFADAQSGVVTRKQLNGNGVTDHIILGMVQSRRWQRIHPGIYATFNGPVPWLSRVWAGLLTCGPGAVVGDCCALRLWDLRFEHDDAGPIRISVDHGRRARVPPSVILQRNRRLAAFVHPVRMPPVMRVEHAALQLASRGSLAAAVTLMTDICQQRLTTPARLTLAIRDRPGLRLGSFLADLLDDVASGTHSYLELTYLRGVERAHNLPTGQRQSRASDGTRIYYRDVAYEAFGVVIELDGRLGHESGSDRWADLERDMFTASQGSVTVRLGYGQVLANPCRTAGAIAMLLRRRGWIGRLKRCGPQCRLDLSAEASKTVTPSRPA